MFLVNDARLEGYRSITASGTENINNMHYFRNTSSLKDGDLVLMDYAPDYRYYTSDIGRVWPVNGKYAPWQRELVQFILEYRNAVMTRHPSGRDQPADHGRRRKRRWSPSSRGRSSPSRRSRRRRGRSSKPAAACFRTPSGWRCTTSAATPASRSKPGQVFSVDPQLWVREENLYLRYEDTVVVTETGVENFTDFLPSELADMEKLVQEKGVVQKVPPSPAAIK